MYRIYLPIFFAITALLFSCSDKHSSATITRKIEEKNCVIVSSASRDVQWKGIGPGARVLPIMYPSTSRIFVSYVVIDEKDTITLEYDDGLPILDSIELIEYMQSMKMSFSSKFKHVWFYRKHDRMTPKENSIIIHALNDTFSFYTHVLPVKPKWKLIKSPRFYFNELLTDTGITLKQSKLVWNYINYLAPNDPTVLKAFPLWQKNNEATAMILSRNSYYNEEYHTPTWDRSIRNLIHKRSSILSRQAQLNEKDIDEIRDLKTLSTDLMHLPSFIKMNNLVSPHLLSNKALHRIYFDLFSSYRNNLEVQYSENFTKEIDKNSIPDFRKLARIEAANKTNLLRRVKTSSQTKNYMDNVLSLYKLNSDFKDSAINLYCINMLSDSCFQNPKAFTTLRYGIGDYASESEKKFIYKKIQPALNGPNDSLAKILLRCID